MAPLAARFYGDPSARCASSASPGPTARRRRAFLVARAARAPRGEQCALLGHRQVGDRRPRGPGRAHDARRRSTSRRAFAAMLDAGDRACAIEVSSHALALHRADGDPLRGRDLHQPDPGPPRLPRDDGGLLRRQAAAVRGRVRRARRSTSTTPTAAGSPPSIPTPSAFALERAGRLRRARAALRRRRRAASSRSTPEGELEIAHAPAGRASTSPTCSARSPPTHRLGVPLETIAARAARGRARRPGASRRSTRASRSACSSTTPTPPTRSRTSCAPRAR